jgi:hypothetical protein
VSGKFTDHFVITSIAREPDLGFVTVSVRFDTGPRVYEFYIPYDEYSYDKELIGSQIEAQMGS